MNLGESLCIDLSFRGSGATVGIRVSNFCIKGNGLPRRQRRLAMTGGSLLHRQFRGSARTLGKTLDITVSFRGSEATVGIRNPILKEKVTDCHAAKGGSQ